MRENHQDLVGRSLSHYRVLGRLGKGGMGEVFLAEDRRLGRRTALKILPPELAAERRHLERFQREARSVAALNHPNIVTLYSVEETEGLHFLVMELIEGETLAEILSAGRLPLPRLLSIAIPLAEALEAAHACGVIHRDLKPQNVMVRRDGQVKILDFGLARQHLREDLAAEPETDLTRSGQIVGTTPYMSPEQIADHPLDHRSDLFSLGVMLYEMVTGRRPFQGKGRLAIMASILQDTPPPASGLVADLPVRFDQILDLCLAKAPSLRYASARELGRDLLSLASEASGDFQSTVHEISPPLPSSGLSTRLPARPRCYGRESEIRDLVAALRADAPRAIPVLGPAGAGKTTLALAALHDRQVTERFGKRRWLVRCDGVTSRDSLLGVIARCVCPDAAPPLEPKVFLELETAPAALVLDNFETPWERDTAAVEELLTQLAAVPGLALVVTLRGEERPFGPTWGTTYRRAAPGFRGRPRHLPFAGRRALPGRSRSRSAALRPRRSAPGGGPARQPGRGGAGSLAAAPALGTAADRAAPARRRTGETAEPRSLSPAVSRQPAHDRREPQVPLGPRLSARGGGAAGFRGASPRRGDRRRLHFAQGRPGLRSGGAVAGAGPGARIPAEESSTAP